MQLFPEPFIALITVILFEDFHIYFNPIKDVPYWFYGKTIKSQGHKAGNKDIVLGL